MGNIALLCTLSGGQGQERIWMRTEDRSTRSYVAEVLLSSLRDRAGVTDWDRWDRWDRSLDHRRLLFHQLRDFEQKS